MTNYQQEKNKTIDADSQIISILELANTFK